MKAVKNGQVSKNQLIQFELRLGPAGLPEAPQG